MLDRVNDPHFQEKMYSATHKIKIHINFIRLWHFYKCCNQECFYIGDQVHFFIQYGPAGADVPEYVPAILW